jgi:PTS system nitrogen regulatory IIA component
MIACVGISTKPIPFDSFDGEPARIFIMTLSPPDKTGPHLQFLAEVSRLFKSDDKRKALLAATSRKQILEILTTP